MTVTRAESRRAGEQESRRTRLPTVLREGQCRDLPLIAGEIGHVAQLLQVPDFNLETRVRYTGAGV